MYLIKTFLKVQQIQIEIAFATTIKNNSKISKDNYSFFIKNIPDAK